MITNKVHRETVKTALKIQARQIYRGVKQEAEFRKWNDSDILLKWIEKNYLEV